MGGGQEPHPYEDIDSTDVVVVSQSGFRRLNYPALQRLLIIGMHLPSRVPASADGYCGGGGGGAG